ncbi:hypothetical protein BC831DRAFT_513862 [Entophlyctis helioformis]|nr:hypothetical protein BC831DRAFT_513862 [Entophlyctis helioformis]
MISKPQVLALYRQLLRDTRSLSLSNVVYVRAQLRAEFERSRGVRDPTAQLALFRKGMYLADTRLGGLI